MNSVHIFSRLILTDIKRLKNYILAIIISSALIVTFCGAAGFLLSKNIYRESKADNFTIAYYLPEDSNKSTNMFAINILENIKSMKSVATLVQTETIAEGYEMLQNNQALYYIIVPENFFSGILNGTNTPLEIVVLNNSSMSAYIANEMFVSYAQYLGLAQAGVYSLWDAVEKLNIPTENAYSLQNSINMTFLDRSLNKDNFIEIISATSEGDFSLLQHYMGVAVLLSLFLISFVLFPHLQGVNTGILLKLKAYKINKLHIMVSNLICCMISLYIAYLPCYIGISIINKHFNIQGLVTILTPVAIISIIISTVSIITKNSFSGNMTILVISLILTYSGGGIIPSAMLPAAVKDLFIAPLGNNLITEICHSLYGF